MKLSLVLISLTFLFLGCSKKIEPLRISSSHPNISNTMKLLLKDLKSVLYERHKSELERDEERQRYALRFANRAIEATKELQSYPNKDKEFYLLVEQLREKATNIKQLANTFQIKRVDNAIVDIRDTCSRCHQRLKIAADIL